MESRSSCFCLLYIYLVFVHMCVQVYMHADIREANFLSLTCGSWDLNPYHQALQ